MSRINPETKMTPERLRELQAAGLPRMTWRDVLEVKEGGSLSAEEDMAMEAYFRQFVKADGCVCCGKQQGGDIIASLIGNAYFRWGIAHGEGFCSNCGYPARAYHFNVGPIKRLPIILQYHPEDLKEWEPA